MLSADDIYAARILVVDDSQDNVDLLMAVLEQEGYLNLSATTSPSEAVELHRLHHYDLILLDIQMPVMDGFKVMDALNQLGQDAWLPVLAITAHPDYKISALEAGAMDFITKPFDVNEIIQRIRNLLEVRLRFNLITRHSAALQQQALHDPLTGLPNRRLLDDRIGIALEHARRNSSHVAVLYADLDGFKQVNDKWGHEAGDLLLQLVAQRLTDASRGEDTVARIGGDEFIVVLGAIGSCADVDVPARKLIDAIAAPYLLNGIEVSVTTSIGISISALGAISADGLIRRADKALYYAKQQGKNCFHVALPEPQSEHKPEHNPLHKPDTTTPRSLP